MKKLEEMGLVHLSKKESVEHDGGNNKSVFKGIKPGDVIVCCINIPPVKLPGDGIFGIG